MKFLKHSIVVLVFSLLLASLGGNIISLTLINNLNKNIIALTEKNQELKLRNTTTAQECFRFRGIDDEAVRTACFVFPIPPKALNTIRRIENGTTAELGYHGKTDFICKYFPENQWQYLEAARLISDEAVQFAFADENFNKFIDKYLAPRYNTNPQWGKNFKKVWHSTKKTYKK
jgi:hypothetical protein